MTIDSLLYVVVVIPTVWGGCPFQNPFFFVDRPSVLTVVDSDGEMVADRLEIKEDDLIDDDVEHVTESELAGDKWRTLSAWTTSRSSTTSRRTRRARPS